MGGKPGGRKVGRPKAGDRRNYQNYIFAHYRYDGLTWRIQKVRGSRGNIQIRTGTPLKARTRWTLTWLKTWWSKT